MLTEEEKELKYSKKPNIPNMSRFPCHPSTPTVIQLELVYELGGRRTFGVYLN